MKSMIRLREVQGNSFENEKRFLESLHGKRGDAVEPDQKVFLMQDTSPFLTQDGKNIIL